MADFLEGRVILLNKIAGLDRRDQVILEGRHIATLWFDVTAGCHKLDLETAGAALLCSRAKNGLVVCDDSILRGHIKGKWLAEEMIMSGPSALEEGQNVALKIGKFSGVGVVRKKADGSQSIRIKDVTKSDFSLSENRPTLDDIIFANEQSLKGLEKAAINEIKKYLSKNRHPVMSPLAGEKTAWPVFALPGKYSPGQRYSLSIPVWNFLRPWNMCKSCALTRSCGCRRSKERATFSSM